MQKFNRLLHCLLASNVAVEKVDVILIPSHLWGFMGGVVVVGGGVFCLHWKF